MIRNLFFAFFLLLSFCGKTAAQTKSQQATTTSASSSTSEPTMDVYLWFDTEDYLLPASDDAALRLANFLTQEGVRATFKVVGEKARTLERRGRQDVIDALKKHEIGYHSNWHSVHPTPAQYLSALGWDEGVQEFVRREGPGVQDLNRIFGQQPSCYGQPGSSWGPQSFGAMHQLNIPVYLDAGSHISLNKQPLWYGGILTIFNLAHTLRAELEGKQALEQAKTNFLAAQKQVMSQGGGAVHIYYHPCEWVHKEFWDGVNFSNGANPPREEWKLPPQKTAQETKVAFEIFESYVKWIKKQKGVRFLTAKDALKRYEDKALTHQYTPSEIDEIAQAIRDSITFQTRNNLSLSPAEIFVLLNTRLAALANKAAGGQSFSLPRVIAGPTEPGPEMNGSYTTSWSQLCRTAVDVDAYLTQHKRIPSSIWVGSQAISPEAYLATLAKIVPTLSGNTEPENIQIQSSTLATTQYMAEDNEELWGWLFPKGWHAPALIQLAKLQAWTIKPALRNN